MSPCRRINLVDKVRNVFLPDNARAVFSRGVGQKADGALEGGRKCGIARPADEEVGAEINFGVPKL